MAIRRNRGPVPARLDLPPSPGELRCALREARRLWRLQQDTVRGHESMSLDRTLGIELASASPEVMLEVARREAFFLGLVVESLEARVSGRPQAHHPPAVERRIEEATKLLIWSARQYQEIHGHLPHDGPFDRVLWAG